MEYTRTETEVIKFNYDDVLGWARSAAAKQMAVHFEDIKEENVQITPENLKDIDITVSFSKITSNIKPEST